MNFVYWMQALQEYTLRYIPFWQASTTIPVLVARTTWVQAGAPQRLFGHHKHPQTSVSGSDTACTEEHTRVCTICATCSALGGMWGTGGGGGGLPWATWEGCQSLQRLAPAEGRWAVAAMERPGPEVGRLGGGGSRTLLCAPPCGRSPSPLQLLPLPRHMMSTSYACNHAHTFWQFWHCVAFVSGTAWRIQPFQCLWAASRISA